LGKTMNMKRLSCLVLLILVLLSTLQGCNRTPGTDDNDYSASIIYGGLERTYSVHISNSYDQTKATPLVIALHGGGGTGKGVAKLTGFNAISDRENFIVAYPDGFEKHWNDSRGVQWQSQVENTDDVGFISALIDRLSDELNIDAKRVYVTGISNGGMMSHRLGCELSQKIAAIAPIASNIPVNQASVWMPSRPVPVLIINGTDDPLVPWDGGDIHIGKTTLGEVLSVADTVKFWVGKDQCSSVPAITQLPDEDPSDGTMVWKEIYSGCRDGVEVVLYAIEGGGHTWPGGLPHLPKFVIGKTSKEFNASEVIWQFFKEHPME
jgi:polyhydroxybutyrate depolymerase